MPSTGYDAIDIHWRLMQEALEETDPEARELIYAQDVSIAVFYKRQIEDFIKDEIQRAKQLDQLAGESHPEEYYTQRTAHWRSDSYPAFKQLAVIYEKSGQVQAAVALCKEAIALGYTRDGTKGGMEARLAKLMKKMET